MSSTWGGGECGGYLTNYMGCGLSTEWYRGCSSSCGLAARPLKLYCRLFVREICVALLHPIYADDSS